MVIPSHQSEKLSQLQTMLGAGRVTLLPVADRLELRRLVDAYCHPSKVTDRPAASTNKVDAAVKALKRCKSTLPAIYHGKITNLIESLNIPSTIAQASDAIRQLIKNIALVPEGNTLHMGLFGELPALVALGIGPNF